MYLGWFGLHLRYHDVLGCTGCSYHRELDELSYIPTRGFITDRCILELEASSQIVVSWNAKLHGLYITIFVAVSCSGGDLTIDANSQCAVVSQLRRHIHDVIMAGDGPSVFFTSEHVIPVLIEHKFLASTLRACDSVSTQKWNRRSEPCGSFMNYM